MRTRPNQFLRWYVYMSKIYTRRHVISPGASIYAGTMFTLLAHIHYLSVLAGVETQRDIDRCLARKHFGLVCLKAIPIKGEAGNYLLYQKSNNKLATNRPNEKMHYTYSAPSQTSF